MKDNQLFAFINNAVNSTMEGMLEVGYANGYVALPPSHPLHNVSYSEIDRQVDVHGGMTFGCAIAQFREHEDWQQHTECIDFDSLNDIPEDYYVVGFDTMHIGDSGLDKNWCIQETLRLKTQLEAMM